MVRKVKEILTGKYMIYTVSAIYMANIIWSLSSLPMTR
jgi:hypothetical protein